LLGDGNEELDIAQRASDCGNLLGIRDDRFFSRTTAIVGLLVLANPIDHDFIYISGDQPINKAISLLTIGMLQHSVLFDACVECLLYSNGSAS
jgi:hypothetical protein